MSSLGVALADLVRDYTGHNGAVRSVYADAGEGVMEVEFMVFDQDGLDIVATDDGFTPVVETVTVHLSDSPAR